MTQPRRTLVTALQIQLEIRRVYGAWLADSRPIYMRRGKYTCPRYRALMGCTMRAKAERLDVLHVAATEWAKAHAGKRKTAAERIEGVLHAQCDMIAAAMVEALDVAAPRTTRALSARLPDVGTSSDVKQPHKAFMPRDFKAVEVRT